MNRKIVVTWLCLIMQFCFVVIVIDISTPVKAETIWIDDSFSTEDATHKKTIQAGIDNATFKDTVYVYNGTYYENIVVNKSISLIGEDIYSTEIVGGDNGDVVYVNSDWVNITGFTIRGSGFRKAGIELNNVQFCKIAGNNLKNNSYDIYLESSCYNYIMNNNISFYNREGISLRYSNGNNITSNIITSSRDAGIFTYNSNENIVIDNIVSSVINSGIHIYNSSKNYIYGNRVNNSYRGITIQYTGENTIIGNIASYNREGINLHGAENNNISYNIIYDNEDGIILNDYWPSKNNSIFSNDITDNVKGIFLSASSESSTINNNNISYNDYGVYLSHCSNHNQIYDNIISNNEFSIYTTWILTEDLFSNNVFKNNSNHYQIDSDGDGVVDNLDFDPNDPTVHTDSDGDGHPDNRDAFPFNSDEWKDTDRDGIGDNSDSDNNGNIIPDDFEIPLAIFITLIPFIMLFLLFKRMKKRKDLKGELSLSQNEEINTKKEI